MDAKADVNVKSKESDYPIFMAINNRSVKLTEALVEHKADLNLLNKEGKSPLMLAVEGGSLDLVHCLLKHKNRDFNQKNLKGETALDVAVLGGDCYMVIELIYANLACKIPQLQFFLEEQLKINPLDHDLKMAYSHFKKTYLSDEPKVEPTQSIKPMLDKTTTKITT